MAETREEALAALMKGLQRDLDNAFSNLMNRGNGVSDAINQIEHARELASQIADALPATADAPTFKSAKGMEHFEVAEPATADKFNDWWKTQEVKSRKELLEQLAFEIKRAEKAEAELAALEAATAGRSDARCPDCDEAAKHAYSDATTPGFFYAKCEKHRAPTAPSAEPSDRERADRWLSKNVKFAGDNNPDTRKSLAAEFAAVRARPTLTAADVREADSPVDTDAWSHYTHMSERLNAILQSKE